MFGHKQKPYATVISSLPKEKKPKIEVKIDYIGAQKRKQLMEIQANVNAVRKAETPKK